MFTECLKFYLNNIVFISYLIIFLRLLWTNTTFPIMYYLLRIRYIHELQFFLSFQFSSNSHAIIRKAIVQLKILHNPSVNLKLVAGVCMNRSVRLTCQGSPAQPHKKNPGMSLYSWILRPSAVIPTSHIFYCSLLVSIFCVLPLICLLICSSDLSACNRFSRNAHPLATTPPPPSLQPQEIWNGSPITLAEPNNAVNKLIWCVLMLPSTLK